MWEAFRSFLLVLHLDAVAIYVQEYIRQLEATSFDGESGMQQALGAIRHDTLADASERGVPSSALASILYSNNVTECMCIIHPYIAQPVDHICVTAACCNQHIAHDKCLSPDI